MTKKHFAALAEAISGIIDPSARLNAAAAVAMACSKMNPRFDAARFYTACGID